MLLREAVVMFGLPFVLLIFINGLSFSLWFVLSTSVFYLLVVGYLISEISVKPPWYHHHPGAPKLTTEGLPHYWGASVTNPMVDFDIAFNDVTFPSSGYTLSAWHVPRPANGPRSDIGLVMVHGGGRDRRAWLRHVPMFHAHGYGQLLFDLREHGLSSGASRGFTYGIKERFDVVAAAAFTREKLGYRRIVVIGTSVGGAASLMAAAIDPSICAVVAENPITTCARLQDEHIVRLISGYFAHNRYSVVLFSIFRFICSNWLNFKVGNKPTKRCQAIQCIHSISPRPVLLMHGTNDEVVPVDHSQQLFHAAREPKELWICEGAFHCGLYNKEQARFEEVVTTFLRNL